MKHTSGKWKIRKGTESNGGGAFSISDSENWNIATIWNGKDVNQTKPNAKLISQSPNMLRFIIETKEALTDKKKSQKLSIFEGSQLLECKTILKAIN